MHSLLSTKNLTILSMAFGICVAILAVAYSSAVGAFAMVGALVLGFLWSVRGILGRRTP